MEKPRFTATKKQSGDAQYIFEYWEGENSLQAVGSEAWVDSISHLLVSYRKLPKDKPPLLRSDEVQVLLEQFFPLSNGAVDDAIIGAIAGFIEAQREADIKHYEGGDNGQSNSKD